MFIIRKKGCDHEYPFEGTHNINRNVTLSVPEQKNKLYVNTILNWKIV